MNSYTLMSYFLLAFLFVNSAIAGPSCEKIDYAKERFISIQTEFIDGYRFDITKPPVYSENSKVYSTVENGEGCDGDSFILITNETGEIVYFQRTDFPLQFAEKDLHKLNNNLGEADVAIFHHSGGGSCCESLYLFKTTPRLQFMKKIPAVLK